MKVEKWTVQTRAGETVAQPENIIEWLKVHPEALVVARINCIQTIIIY